MFPLGSKRRKKSHEFEILVVPKGDGGGTRSIHAGLSKLALWGSAATAVLFLLFFLAFRFTPLSRFMVVQQAAVPADDETERRIRALAEEVAVLKDYNETLRKALGERVERKDDSAPMKNEEQKIEEAGSMAEPLSQTVSPSERDDDATHAQRTRRAEVLSASLPLFTPTRGVATQGFDPDERHFGIDYAAKEGAPVYAAAKGYVVFSGWTFDDGNVVILSHGGGVMTVYKHNASLMASVGTIVKRGDVLALVGSTGRTSKGPHLHFEVHKDGAPQNPNLFLLNTKTTL